MGELSEVGDSELVRRSRRGEDVAFGELVRRYARAAYSVALSVTGGHEDAEDAAQEAFVVALDKLDECRDPGRFAGWLLTIVRNRSRNLMCHEALRKTETIPFSLPSRAPGPERSREQAALRDRLTKAVQQLSEVQREVLLLHDLEGWKHREIAERLEMPPGTVRSHLHYARKRVRSLLAPAGSDGREERTG